MKILNTKYASVEPKIKKMISTKLQLLGMSRTALAKKANISQTTVNTYLRKEEGSTSFNIILCLCEALDIKLERLIELVSEESSTRKYLNSKVMLLDFMEKEKIDENILTKEDYKFLQDTILYVVDARKKRMEKE